MIQRAVVLSLALLLATAGVKVASRGELVPAREPLANVPLQISDWRGESADRFDQQVLTVLGVDDYLNRIYTSPAVGGVGFYIGAYFSQREGSKLHSPMVCLPGAGWEMAQQGEVAIQVATPSGSRTVVVNRLVIAKGLNKQVVLYWYQSQGRVIANEYWGKLYSILDAVKNRRTDTAIVRVISPVVGTEPEAEARAERAAVAFTQAAFPLLGRYLPD